MAQARFLAGGTEPLASFALTFRRLPFAGGFAVCAGLGEALAFLASWHFDAEDCAYLATLNAADGSPLFDERFLAHLSEARFTGDVEAIAEGRVVFAGEPLLRVTGPVSLCQMVETPLLNLVNFSTLIATKAARCVIAADGDRVLEFGMRRAQGPNGALMASRAAFIGGVDATSNTFAGRTYGIPVAGTHAHSWIMSYPSELEAFRAYVETSPSNAILLVDTYDTIGGVKHAIEVAGEMEARGQRLRGIRIDSGDLAWLSQQARALLDEAGLGYVEIVASNSLDEYTISSLKEQGARIDVWGVGTAMVTGGEQSALDGVYKMTAIQDIDGSWQPRMKLSDQIAKATLPGIHGVRRFYDAVGFMIGDMVYGIEDAAYRVAEVSRTYVSPTDESDESHCAKPWRPLNLCATLSASSNASWSEMVDPVDVTRRKRFAADTPCEELLQPVMRAGAIVDAAAVGDEALEAARERLRADLTRLDNSHKRFLRPHTYPVGIEESLNDARIALVRTLRDEERA